MVRPDSKQAPRQAAGSGHGRDRGARAAARREQGPTTGDAPDAPVRKAVPAGGRERAVLVGVATHGLRREVVEAHLDELGQLVDTAGGQAVARMVQERKSPDPATYIGKGKVAELAALAGEHGARLVVFDDDLSSSQARHLDEALPADVKVLDRAGVILDIFALRARTREAQLQVELAQLTYQMSRLTRRWSHLSRQAGGIGTRGVGETQLETVRRVIRRRITTVRERLDLVEREREVQRKRRAQLPAVALVGYTNAGKSTLFERLTGASTLVEDRLFATLDPRTRRAEVGDGVAIAVADTVGFIRKLPHHLVASFRATLAEAALAQIVVHLVDASHPDWADQLAVGEEVLASLGVEPKGCIVVLNKVDRLDGALPPAPLDRTVVAISALTGEGIDALKSGLRTAVLSQPGLETIRFPAAGGEALQRALQDETVVARRFTEDGIELVVRRR
jgi:GTPase